MDVLSSALLALLFTGYLVLAGSDVGLGMLMPVVARTPDQRRRAVSAVAPYFLASEVWLVAAVGVLAGLFPLTEHHLVAELWPVLVALLAGWLVRDAGLWLRARTDRPGWRSACDGAVVAGGWAIAVAWGLVVAGLLTGGLVASPFTAACAATVACLFAFRGAAFGAERLAGADDCDSADVAARATRLLARAGLGLGVLAVVTAFLPGGPAGGSPIVATALAAALLGALVMTSGLSGPMLSRHTSAVAIAVPGALVALTADLPTAPIPDTTVVFVWAGLAPMVPVMVLGQVWLYRMTRRPAVEPTFFA